MAYKIITNNPAVQAEYGEVLFVKGDFEKVLVATRDSVYSGHQLITHPLAASIRMFFSPYRSIMVSDSQVFDISHMEMIENSLETYRKQMGQRQADEKNAKDYALIDLDLLRSAIGEHERLHLF